MIRLFFLLILFLPLFINAQNVAINNDGSSPHNSAILDISSTTKGILIPRMSSLEKLSIQGPTIGLMIFDTDTYSHWIFRGDVNGGWAELLHTFDRHWEKTGTNIFNNNSGFIGLGTNNPGEKLSINGTNPSIQLLNGGSAKAFVNVTGNNFRLGTYANNSTGQLVLGTKGVDHVFINSAGLVGIGTSTPASELTINGTSPYIQMQHENSNTGFLLAVNNELRLGTNSTNTTGDLVLQTKLIDRMTIDETGRVGIGTSSPSSILTLNGNEPILQLRNDNVDKGYIQLVNNDIKLGTNVSNAFGKVILRTGGADRLTVSKDGQIGIGTNLPNQTLAICADHPSIGFNSTNNSLRGEIQYDDYSDLFKIIKSNTGVGKIWIQANGGTGFGIHMPENGHFNFGSGLDPTGYLFSIQGKAIATEFTTLAVANWPDYVFSDSYNLMPLHNLKEYINTHHHLPNIPSAAEIETNGVALGDMSHRLMEKVEELTLYILQLKNEIDELKKK